jgi:starvation-inducible DNA-binding protein
VELQATLVELLDLSLVGKQLHWSVTGPLFRPLHLYLDELIDSWRELSDTVAERAVAVGFWPDGQADAVVTAGRRRSLERGAVKDTAVVRELATRLAELDGASQDVVIEVLRALEEQLWMVRAHAS